MAWYDYLNPSYDYHVAFDTRPPAGVGGPAPVPGRLVQDPSTGYYFDPATGTSYIDSQGTTPVKDPNVAQQVAQNFQTSRDFLGKLGTYADQQQQAFSGQQRLAGNLQDVINGNGPSVANVQLRSGLDQLSREQLGAAAGASGNNAFAAQRTAMNNIAGMGIQTDQAAAMLRAKEQADARTALANVLNQEQAGAGNMYNTNVSGAQGFGALAGGGEGGRESLTGDIDKANKDRQRNYLKDFFSGASSAAGTAATM
jgi:hypothetical protein